jgi:Flp pilus assembly protein TadG
MRKARSRRGIAATELAVILPLFVILGIVPLELCNLIQLKQSVAVAAYEAAKTATRPTSSQTRMMAVFDRVIADREIHGATISASLDVDTLQPGDTVAVTVEAPFSENSFFNVWFLTTAPTSTVTMIKE